MNFITLLREEIQKVQEFGEDECLNVVFKHKKGELEIEVNVGKEVVICLRAPKNISDRKLTILIIQEVRSHMVHYNVS